MQTTREPGVQTTSSRVDTVMYRRDEKTPEGSNKAADAATQTQIEDMKYLQALIAVSIALVLVILLLVAIVIYLIKIKRKYYLPLPYLFTYYYNLRT